MWASLAFKEVLKVPIGLGQLLAFAMVTFYAGAGFFLCFSGSRLARRLGMVAWMLFAVGFLMSSTPDLITRMVVFCVITILVFNRLRVVPTNPEAIQIPLETCTPEGRSAFLARRLSAEFGIPLDRALSADSFCNVHIIAPGRLASFLDDLHCDFGFRISGSEADRVDSGAELLSLVDQRHPYAGSDTKDASTTS
jgi:hypothetical protein